MTLVEDSRPGPPSTVRVLHVDDDRAFADLTATFLETLDGRYRIDSAHSAEEGLARLDGGDVDCIVSDYDMPGKNGLAFLEAVRARDPQLPFVLFTGKGSEEVASAAISAGVTDYLQKGTGTEQYEILANRVANAVEKRRSEADLERHIGQYEVLSSLGRRALETDDLSVLFESAAELVSARLETSLTTVLELQPDGKQLSPRAGVGWDEGLVGTVTPRADGGSLGGYTLQQADAVVVEDLGTETRFDDPTLLTDHGVVSGICAVIGSASDPWGVLGTYATTRRTFTPQDVTFVENVANVLAAAIDRHETEHRFRELAELSPDTVFQLDADGRFVYVSPASEELLGCPPTAVVGTHQSAHVGSVSQPAADEALARAVAGETVRGLELQLRGVDGRTVDTEVSLAPAEGDTVQGIVRDVTDRKRLERALRTEEEHFRTALRESPLAAFRLDTDLRYTWVAEPKDGFEAPGILGKRDDELLPPAAAEAVLAPKRRVLETGEPVREEVSYDLPGGTVTHDLSVAPIRDDDGELVGLTCTTLDLTETRARERKLDRLRERSHALLYTESMDETIETALEAADAVIGAPYTTVWLVNEAADALEPVPVGTADPTPAVPLTYPRDSPPGSRAAVVWGALRRDRPLRIDDTTAYDPLTEDSLAGSGFVYPLSGHGVLTVAAPDANRFDGTDEALVELLARSLSAALDRVARESRLRERERHLLRQNERLDEFASLVSHDLRNPLSVASSYLSLATTECESDHLSHVAAAHSRMSALVDDLLSLARDGRTPHAVEPLELAELARSAWLFVDTGTAELVVESDVTIPAERNRLQQLFENLFANAVQHGVTDPEESPAVTVTVGPTEDGFFVADDGPGIPPEDRERVTEGGHSTSPEGTGFGLRIVATIAEAHGWTLTVTESATGGARFEITGVEPLGATD